MNLNSIDSFVKMMGHIVYFLCFDVCGVGVKIFSKGKTLSFLFHFLTNEKDEQEINQRSRQRQSVS